MEMSHFEKSKSRCDELADQLRESLDYEANKPDFRELDLGSLVSPLRPRPSSLTLTTTPTSSSSSSSGSASGRNGNNQLAKRSEFGPGNHSGELSGSSESSPNRNPKPGQATSEPGTTSHPLVYSGQSTATSPAANVLPTGNICPSGRVVKTGMAAIRSPKSDVLRSASGHYGHGSIMRAGIGGICASRPASIDNARGEGDAGGRIIMTVDPEEMKRLGNEMYKKGHFVEALTLYDKAVALSPGNVACRSNRAAALTGLGRIGEAVRECEEAVRLDPNYGRAHRRLASLMLRLGQVENARKHLCFPGQQPDPTELHKLNAIEKHINKSTDARRVRDWKSTLRECDAAIASGADFSPQLSMCRVEALLKLHQLDDAECSLSNIPRVEPYSTSCSETRFFGMLSEAYPFFVRAQIEMAQGRFEDAVTAAEKAGRIDSRNVEVAVLFNNVKLVARARARGNDLFKSERFTEACSAYGDGLKLDSSNKVLYCNRAACWFKLGQWERSIEDCDEALHIDPCYTKAFLRRAASYSKLERWADAVRDYEVLWRKLPDDNNISESLFNAQVGLKKSRGEEVLDMKFGREVSSVEQFKAAISLPGVCVVHFKAASDSQCNQISPFMDTLCSRYPSINFLKVDINENQAVANAEDVKIVPTFKIYKNGIRVKEIVCPSRNMLEHSVRHYSF